MPCYEIDGIRPVVNPAAYVHPTAVLIGDVIIGAGCYVGPCAVLRGDFGPIRLHEHANLQDTCVMHGFPGIETIVESHGHIGHGAILHGCIIRKNALIGMNSVIMDEAEIGQSSIVGAMAFVKGETKFPAKSLIVGSPAKVLRQLSDKEISWKRQGTEIYKQLARRSQEGMLEITPLEKVEENRGKIDIDYKTLAQTKNSSQ